MDIKKKLDMFVNETFLNEKLEHVVGDRFGRYSKYIIQDRAIPDVRDGLKPVQRRILYAMNELKITSNASYKKCARITGEVMGKYHPHGDSSIYEALVRMSQSWKMSVRLIDIHGNNGSIDGDGPAAMRYTEARMSKEADFLLQDINKNTVPFIPNFDEEEKEPTVLPAKFPNLLVNGCMGISSGYATYIPTHNLNETISATIALIDDPNMSVDTLMTIMKGPDFPTGGIVLGTDGIREAFLTGSGAVVVRSKYFIEEINKEQKRIVVTEIPYDTFKSKTVERIEQLRIEGKVSDIQEVRDESDREGLRIAIDLKKNANENAIVYYLFKNTDLQINLKYNMVSICDRKPLRLGVIPILTAYINHQKEVITNRTNFELANAKAKLHIDDGLVKMVSIVDLVIKTIRESSNKATSKQNLVDKFQFTEAQAEAIVTMQLYRLSSTDIQTLLNEQADLNEKVILYNKILSSEKELLKVIKKELEVVNKTIVSPRKTEITDEVAEIKISETDLIAKEQVVLCISKEGYLKKTSPKSFQASKLNGLKENDSIVFLKEVFSLDTLLMFTNMGNYVYLPVYKIPECKFKDIGTFVSTFAQLDHEEKIIGIYCIKEFTPNVNVLFMSKNGNMKQTLLSDLVVSRYNKTVRCMKLAKDDLLASVSLSSNPLEIIAVTKNAEVLRFRANEISLYGHLAGGIKGVNLKNKDQAISAFYANKFDDILLFTSRNTIKRIKVTDCTITKRARCGYPMIKYLKSNPYLVVDAKAMTPNQYKEDVKINLIYETNSSSISSFSLKYNVSDAGKAMENNLEDPCFMILDEPQTKDDFVSGDYLIIPKTDIFSMEDDSSDNIPLQNGKESVNILDELDFILSKERETTTTKDEMIKSEPIEKTHKNKEDSEEENKEVAFKKVSLFED